MKTLATTLMISLSVLAGAAQAADESTKTRAQVVAELQQAQSQGLISYGEQAYPVEVGTANSNSRADVLAELAAAQKADAISNGELDYPPVAGIDSNKTRAEVQAELFNYVSSGHAHQVEA
ncbi:DUF4148 domain-containing protein [Pollutimonas sp. H1-120]|uniref:DUF4148 domain-containing protein n=1 Tax=Pollutimonas sp. H1-120 TaxID=3148824 RepID=UPI003B528A03